MVVDIDQHSLETIVFTNIASLLVRGVRQSVTVTRMSLPPSKLPSIVLTQLEGSERWRIQTLEKGGDGKFINA